MKISPKLILTATQGRTGTKFLSHVLGHYPGVASFHEPEPNFAGRIQACQDRPVIAEEFLLAEKIPAMARYANFAVYAEISHLWCKGLLQAWLRMALEPVPDLVILDRPLRNIALSMLSLGTIPGRTPSGLRWYLSPVHSGNELRWEESRSWTDYQCCYAYCLEVEARKRRLSAEIRSAGGIVWRTSVEEISQWRGFFHMRRVLGLSFPTPRSIYSFAHLKRNKINTQQKGKHRSETDLNKVAFEEEELKASVVVGKSHSRPASSSMFAP